VTTKCTGIMGRMFGHKFIAVVKSTDSGLVDYLMLNMKWLRTTLDEINYCICQRCGAVTGEKK